LLRRTNRQSPKALALGYISSLMLSMLTFRDGNHTEAINRNFYSIMVD
jgi:hypothetical protein